MTMESRFRLNIFGNHDDNTINQMERCVSIGNVLRGVLCADGHYGYSQSVGGVVAYRDMIAVSGVGYDIGCGNKAVETNRYFKDIKDHLSDFAKEIESKISFGMGRDNAKPIDHKLFDSDVWNEVHQLKPLKDLARKQLGTVGSGNHYVDIFRDIETDKVWIGCHFGSRGFGHKVASGFLNMIAGRPFGGAAPGESMDQPPTLADLKTQLGQDYMLAMGLAGEYAYAGRDYVIDTIVKMMCCRVEKEIHNHHNFAWKENHDGEDVYVVRKGATPCFPNQESFIGGSMADISVIVRGKESEEAKASMYSTVHGAGRVMSRNAARGKWNKQEKCFKGGCITEEQMKDSLREYGVLLRGGGTDESPFVYRKLHDVLEHHKETLDIVNVLKPVIVVMAGNDIFDPYKD